LKLLISLFRDLDESDYISMTQCFLHLKDSYSCAETLKSLVNGDEVIIKFNI